MNNNKEREARVKDEDQYATLTLSQTLPIFEVRVEKEGFHIVREIKRASPIKPLTKEEYDVLDWRVID